MIFIDTPGYLGTQNLETKLLEVISMKAIADFAKSLKIIIVLDYHNIEGACGYGIKETINLLNEFFGGKLKNYKSGILIVITKAPNEKTIQEIKNKLVL